MTAAQLEADFLARMGSPFGPFYYALYKEVVWLHAKWNEYRVLYGTTPESVHILNRTAGFLFRIVGDALWADVLLHISRLTDPAATGGSRNLSIQALPSFLGDPLKAELIPLVAIASEKAHFAREHRNKRLAHTDLLHATEPAAAPLSGISRRHVEEMLLALRNVMAPIDKHYRDTTVIYERLISENGAARLLSRLRRSEPCT